jgi:GNAT superfamily N-acetyltransferase
MASPQFRPIQPREQSQAIRLWHAVFQENPGYFARYYDADPWYRQGDSLGAWVNGVLASAVHLCRRPLAWEGSTLLCGGIANVATLPEYRGQGLSRQLLRLTIERMEEIGVDFSMLGTGIPEFYASLGWEIIDHPRFRLTRGDAAMPIHGDLAPAVPTEALAAQYAHAPRPLQQIRPDAYFDQWVGWRWTDLRAELRELPTGYSVLGVPDNEKPALTVIEWRANDAAGETQLIEAALAGRPDGLEFSALPQHLDLTLLSQLGRIERLASSGEMIRRVGLPEEEFARVKEAYVSGQAAVWPADGF